MAAHLVDEVLADVPVRPSEHEREAIERDAQGATNRARELVDMVIHAVPERDVT
jgi:hypothetical protein